MSSEVAASQDPGAPPPERIDPNWLVLQRLDDLKRAQDRLQAQIDDLRREMRQEIHGLDQKIQGLDQKITQLTGWFIAGLITILGTVIGSALALYFATR